MNTILVTLTSIDPTDAEWNGRIVRALRRWGFKFDPTAEAWRGERPLYRINRYSFSDFVGYGLLKVIG